MSWEYKTLDQLGEVSRGRSKHRPRNDPSLYGGEYPFIQTANVKASNFYVTDYDTTYNEKGLAQSKLWHPGTLCITIAANIADTGILAMDACFPDSVMGFLPYEGIAYVRFVKYCFDILQQNCKKISQGAAQDNLSWEKLSTILFPAPPIEVQVKIADILSAYDDLIENNQKQIKLLEEAAQRLYKEWFVDLRFPGYETTPIVDGIPEGWEKRLLSDIIGYEIGGGWGKEKPTERCDIPAYVIRGTDLYGVTHGDSVDIPYRFHEKKNLDARRLADGDIIFEVSGGSKTEGVARTALIRSAMLEQWSEPAMCASFCKLIRVREPKYAQLLFNTFQYMRASGKTTEYDKRSASSIVNYRWKDFLATETVLIPDEVMLEKYNALANNMYQLIVQKSISIEKAKGARNRLLPKLMSGEIEV